jgi:uncharacterized Zn finger protein (UPF0148 family)
MNLLRRCHECGQPLGQKDLFCPRCGAKQPREPKHGASATLRKALNNSKFVTPVKTGVQ